MLDFYFIADEQPNDDSGEQLHYAGSIKIEEFGMAQKSGLIDATDYYTDFRWTSQQIEQKIALLAHCPFHASTVLNGMLNEAKAAGLGLVALAD
ncbi:MAG: hypothetical protein ACRYFK_01405 [Janthinobacterium lividum]